MKPLLRCEQTFISSFSMSATVGLATNYEKISREGTATILL